MNKVRQGILFSLLVLSGFTIYGQRIMENPDRGLVGVRISDNKVYLSWRLLVNDPEGTTFNMYRITKGGEVVKLNNVPIRSGTNFIDSSTDLTRQNAYTVYPVVNGKEGMPAYWIFPANTPVQPYLSVPLEIPSGGEIMGNAYTYNANDASVGDLDGDG